MLDLVFAFGVFIVYDCVYNTLYAESTENESTWTCEKHEPLILLHTFNAVNRESGYAF